MEIKKQEKTLTHLFFGSYTIGFVLGGVAFILSERNRDFQFTFSKEYILCFFIFLPIIYWVYRYSGIVFNNQSLKVKLLYFVLWILGMFFGIVFFEILLNNLVIG